MVPGGLPDALPAWVDQPLVRVVVSLPVVVAGWYLSTVLVRLMGRGTARRFQWPSVTRTILRGVRLAVLAVRVFASMAVLGLPDIVLSVTVFSAVLGLVLAPIVGSVINGLFVLADQPYEIGDLIELVDRQQRGFVEDITLRYTKVFTLDDTFLVVPNSKTWERRGELLGGGRANAPEPRTPGDVRGRPADGALDHGARCARGGGGHRGRAGRSRRECAASGAARLLHPGVRGKRRAAAAPVLGKNPYYLTRVRSKIQETVWAALDDVDVEIAYPHSHLVFDETSGTARVDVDRERPEPLPEDDRAAGRRPPGNEAADDGSTRDGGPQ
jgi:hypothetical protein